MPLSIQNALKDHCFSFVENAIVPANEPGNYLRLMFLSIEKNGLKSFFVEGVLSKNVEVAYAGE